MGARPPKKLRQTPAQWHAKSWVVYYVSGRQKRFPSISSPSNVENNQSFHPHHDQQHIHIYIYITRAPLRGRLTPPPTLAQGIFQLNAKGAKRRGPRFSATSDDIMPRATLCRADCPLCAVQCVCWRCHVLIGSTGVICEQKFAKRTEMEVKINDESKQTSTHTHRLYRHLPPGTSPNTCWYSVCPKESTGLRSAGGVSG